jgi:hypothetical protein
MTNDNLFKQEDSNTTPEPSTTPDPEMNAQANGSTSLLADQLAQIVNEQGQQKYATADKALEALTHSQQHIAKLEEENTKLREQNAVNRSVEDVLSAIQPKQVSESPAPSGLGEEDVLRLLSQREEMAVAQSNAASVVAKMQEVYGEKADEVFYGKAAELGVTNDFMNSVAAKSPQAVFEMFGLNKPKQSSGSEGSVNTEVLAAQNNGANPPPRSNINRIGATTQDLVNEWKAAGQVVQQNLFGE